MKFQRIIAVSLTVFVFLLFLYTTAMLFAINEGYVPQSPISEFMAKIGNGGVFFIMVLEAIIVAFGLLLYDLYDKMKK